MYIYNLLNNKKIYIIKKRTYVYFVCEIVLINILMLKLSPHTKVVGSTPSKVNDDVETLLFPLRTRTKLDLIGI